MSGRSKWATTKHKKATNDTKRGRLFARLIKNIEVAVRTGEDDSAGNPTLFDAIRKAKRSSVPTDSVDRAVKRSSGDGADAVNYGSITYESYASGGVAVLIKCLTDNRNRAASEVRVALIRSGGQLADPGSVAYILTRKGVVEVPSESVSEDNVLTAVLGASVEEVEDEGESFSIYCEPGDIVAVRSTLQDAGIECNPVEAQFAPSVKVEAGAERVRKALRVIDALEDCSDVRDVFSSLNVPEAAMTKLEAKS